MESISQERSSSEFLFRTKDKKSFSTDSFQLVQCSPLFNVLLNGPFKKVEKKSVYQTSAIYLDMTKD